MNNTIRHTILCLAAAAASFLHSSITLMSQELNTPERWESEFKSVNPIFKSDTVTICFLGDIMMHKMQIKYAHKGGSEYDFSSYFHLIEDQIKEADIAVANMEFALGGEPYSGYPAFSAPDQIAEYAAKSGIDIFLMANNHIFDKGKAGAERTLDIYRGLYDSYGVRFTGLAADEAEERSNHPLMVARKGIRLAFINCTYATNGGRRDPWPKVNYMDDKDDMLLALKTAERKHADCTIVLPHWGNEYELIHSDAQASTAHWLASNGADLIIGTHPHVVQDTTSIRTGSREEKVPVVYSLGNAVSNMSSQNTQLELMATVRIVRCQDGTTKVLEPELTFLWCSPPGGFSDNYTIVPIEKYINRRDLWQNIWDFNNMFGSYIRVKETTGIK